ncbi:MAG TPA: type IV pilus assembly protein PilM [Candidatus Paceibacterota bacterium]|jgi:type IV pilus assembly protein PilM|nr:type IV pilus assembly protein PilM [Candidatus Paceibacterota bacterium]
MDNSLKKIIADGLASLKNSFSSGGDKNQALGVDIGSSSIKVVQLKKKGGRAVLETYGVISLGPYGGTSVGALTSLKTEDIARALKDVMKESNVTTKSSILSIPSLASLIFLVTLPGAVKESELENIIPIEARKYIPVPISEVTLDWFVIPNEDEMQENDSPSNIKRNREVLVVAIHNETLTQYREILKQTDLESDAFEMEIFSNIRSTFNNELAPFLIVDFGASKTKVSIVESGVVKVFHVVNRGSHDISRNISQALGMTFEEAEKLKRMVGLDASVNPEVEKIIRLAVNYIFTDINSIVFAYQKKYNKNISKVFLSGGGSLLKGLLEAARENFRVEVFYSNPFSKTEAPAFLEPVLENSGPEFAVAVGLALRQLS